ncbi:MAG: PEP-CTERM system TPR-repeat protein PrsT [Methyloprofundus sp.]|nr:PEP-CTERM system TPR-repeat protein PrsT [Methyloprofundus sp.]
MNTIKTCGSDLMRINKEQCKKMSFSALIMLVLSYFFTPPLQAAIVSENTLNNYQSLIIENDNSIQNYLKARDTETLKRVLNDEANSLAKEGAKQLDKGELKLGLENLNKAWKLNKNLASVGVMLAISRLRTQEYDQVLEVCAELQKTHPKLSDGYILAGIAYLAKNQEGQAIASFKRLLEVMPGEPEASYNLANLAMRRGDTKSARTLFENALAQNPMYFRLIQGLAKLEVIEGHYEKAEGLLTKAMQTYPNSSKPVVELAQLYSVQSDYNRVIKLLEPSLTKYTNNESLVSMLGWAYMQTDQDVKVQKLLQDFLIQSPDSAKAYYVLALVAEKSTKYTDALNYIGKTLEREPTNEQAKFLQALIYSKLGEYKQAKPILEQLLILHPNDAGLLELKAKIALIENQPAQAVVLLQKAIKQQSTNLLVVQLAVAHVRDGNTQSAFDVLNDWLTKYPSDIFTLNALADLALEQDKLDVALQQYQAIIKIKHDDSMAHNNIAFLQLKKGNINLASQHIERAYQLNKSDPNVLDTLAAIQLAMGESDKAIKTFKQAFELEPNDMSIALQLAKALIQAGKAEQAKVILNKIVSTDAVYAKNHQVYGLLKSLE